MQYIDFVIINLDDGFGKVKDLCTAPPFSHLLRGDKVMIGTMMAEVIASETFTNDDNNPTTRMVLDAFDKKSISDVMKLTARVKIIDFIYHD